MFFDEEELKSDPKNGIGIEDLRIDGLLKVR